MNAVNGALQPLDPASCCLIVLAVPPGGRHLAWSLACWPSVRRPPAVPAPLPAAAGPGLQSDLRRLCQRAPRCHRFVRRRRHPQVLQVVPFGTAFSELGNPGQCGFGRGEVTHPRRHSCPTSVTGYRQAPPHAADPRPLAHPPPLLAAHAHTHTHTFTLPCRAPRSLPDIPREQVDASPAMSQMKQAMGQFGPRLSLCVGLQPCSGAPALVMGLTNLTSRVKAKVGGRGRHLPQLICVCVWVWWGGGRGGAGGALPGCRVPRPSTQAAYCWRTSLPRRAAAWRVQP